MYYSYKGGWEKGHDRTGWQQRWNASAQERMRFGDEMDMNERIPLNCDECMVNEMMESDWVKRMGPMNQ